MRGVGNLEIAIITLVFFMGLVLLNSHLNGIKAEIRSGFCNQKGMQYLGMEGCAIKCLNSETNTVEYFAKECK